MVHEKDRVGILRPIILYGNEAWCFKKNGFELYLKKFCMGVKHGA